MMAYERYIVMQMSFTMV